MYLNLNGYQFKANKYRSTYLNSMVTTNQKHITDLQKWRRKEQKHTTVVWRTIKPQMETQKEVSKQELKNQLENKV